MALDVGERRIGVALSDPLGLTAQGLEVYQRRTLEQDLAYLTGPFSKTSMFRVINWLTPSYEWRDRPGGGEDDGSSGPVWAGFVGWSRSSGMKG